MRLDDRIGFTKQTKHFSREDCETNEYCTFIYAPRILFHKPHGVIYTLGAVYRLLRYQLNANWPVSKWKGVGTSASPGRATGCLRYTAAQMFWLTSR